ncbi:hypothetical protein RND71_035954 [Anisodus tanguticus]|uniref:Uncharacterized protein n=1 Tax=Anisodus tanguticus TaxID=243964 RepID=A0AAE1R664_9SOLA|nr:hypothetical protein RND71_035954 [Anisodus tanguticus]
MNLYCLANCKGLRQRKSESKRLRYVCDLGCPFVCLISKDKYGNGINDEGVARSPSVVGLTLEEELELTTPQPTQISQANTSATPLPSQANNSASQYKFMPTPSVPRKQPINSAFNVEPDFEFPSNEESDPVIILIEYFKG